MNQTMNFGEWLKQRRKALDLTQEQLAERAKCSGETIRKIEAGARRPSRQMVEVLAQRLAVPPEERTALVELARGAAGPQVVASAVIRPKEPPTVAPRSNLPRLLTNFVGRQKEIVTVHSLLWRADVRLLTLTGAGGTGKTRLAIQVAADLHQDFQDGVCFVSLASITDPDLVPSSIAHELGIQDIPGQPVMESIKSYLSKKQILLLLDNFEQVLGAAPLVVELLSETARVKVVATSREPLHLYGEHTFPVPPLQLPDSSRVPSLDELYRCESVSLFVQRAKLAKPDFALTTANALAVAAICLKLDGLPLALELAAAYIKVLPPLPMVAQMESRLSLLTSGPRDVPARQRTLRSTIEWSYNLLNEYEPRLFRRLAVFVGGCTFGAIQAICEVSGEPSIDVLEVVASLIDKSLLRQDVVADGEPRFWMLDTIHEYAWEKLQESGEIEPLRRQHALYFMKLAQDVEPQLTHAQQAEWMDRLEDEHNNFLAALRWARARTEARTKEEMPGAAEIGLRIAWAIWRFWEIRGYLSEGRELLEVMLSFQDALSAPDLDRVKARVLYGIGSLCYRQGDYSAARSYYERALILNREIGDDMGIASSLNRLGLMAFAQADFTTARPFYEESLAIYRQSGDEWGIAVVLNNLGNTAYVQGDYDTAHAMHTESLDIRRSMGNKSGIAWSLNNLGNVAFGRGDYNAAGSLYKQSTAIHNELHDNTGIAAGLSGLGASAVGLGNAVRAAHLLGASEALLDAVGATLELDDRIAYDDGVASARSRLGEQTFEQARQEGRAMGLEQAIRYALEES